jgi:hypothetical protein
VRKLSFISYATAASLLAAVIFASAASAQDPQGPPAGAPPAGAPPARGGMQNMAPPKNLKVLPKDLTGRQVRDIMETWADDLGVTCEKCHVTDPNAPPMPNGRPRLNYAADDKNEKAEARIMYTMTEDVKKNYVAKVADMDKMPDPAAPLTCGTCHRGKFTPEAFVPPPKPKGGAAPGGGPGGMPGGMPGMQGAPAAPGGF